MSWSQLKGKLENILGWRVWPPSVHKGLGSIPSSSAPTKQKKTNLLNKEQKQQAVKMYGPC